MKGEQREKTSEKEDGGDSRETDQ